jgi:uncharacterized protein DUF6895
VSAAPAAPPRPVWAGALAWLESHKRHFALADPPDLLALKRLGELANISEVLCRRASAPYDVHARALALLEFGWEQLRLGEGLAAALEARPLPVLGRMYAAFERQGMRHEGVRRRLAALGDPATALKAPPRPAAAPETAAAPYGADGVAVLCLGLARAWEVLGLPSRWRREALFPLTLLARGLPRAPTFREAYSVTHTVFFMTDWGLRPDELPPGAAAALEGAAVPWLEESRAQGDYDVYAELAAALACVGRLAGAEAVEQALRAVQLPDGALAGPPRVRERAAAEADPDARAFQVAYHATLAAALASYAATLGLHSAR